MNFSIRKTAVFIDLPIVSSAILFVWGIGFALGLVVFGLPIVGVVTAFIALTLIATTYILHEIAHAVVGVHFGKKVEYIYFGRTDTHPDAEVGAHVQFVESELVIPIWQDMLIALVGIVVDVIALVSISASALLALALGSANIATFLTFLALLELGALLEDSVSGDGKNARNLLRWLKGARETLRQSAEEIDKAHEEFKKLPMPIHVQIAHLNGIREAQKTLMITIPHLSKSEGIALKKRYDLYESWFLAITEPKRPR